MPIAPPRFHPSGKSREQREAERKARLDATRPSAKERGYDAAWRECRARFLKAHRVCECGAVANEVDHILSVRTHPELRLTWSNLRPLCKPCHSRRTASQQAFANAQPK